MGNNSSALACVNPNVTANPTTGALSDRDVKSLHHLYGHDDELLQLMCGAELLRDCVKSVRDNAAVYFTALTLAARKEREFGDKLAATADRQHTSGMTQSVPAESGDGNFDGTIGDGGGGSGSIVSAAAAPIPGGGSKRAIGSSTTQEPQLQKVLEVQSLLGKFAGAQVTAAESLTRFIQEFTAKINAVAHEVETAHSTKLERHAPSALAHEKAYNHLKAPQDRLAHLTTLPEADREKPDIAKKIDQAEVDLGKREAQLAATSKMLKQRAKYFLDKYTPQVHTLVRAFTVCQHDTIADMSDAVAGVADTDGTDIASMKNECAWFVELSPADLVDALRGHPKAAAAAALAAAAAIGGTASSSSFEAADVGALGAASASA